MEIQQAHGLGVLPNHEKPETAKEYQVGGTHYADMPVQPWDVMRAVLTYEEFIGFLKGNAIKYAMRQGKKVGSDDAGKLQHYLKKLREVEDD